MRFQIILALGFVALASASPLVDKKQQSPLRVVDIPADLFAEAAENVEDVKKPEEVVTADEAPLIPEEKKVEPEEKVEPTEEVAKEEKKEEEAISTLIDDINKKDKNDANETEEIDRPAIFGFRLPTIVILRRPAIFDDPFSFFPFGLSSFNRRPAFGPPPSMIVPDNRDDDVRPTNADASPSVQRPVTIGGSGAGIGDVMHNMRQQMDSLFSSLFAPNPGFFNPNRQFFPRPFFPSVPADSSGEDTKEFLDFGKLPPNYKNSTSETKVVDGKVIEVNKTVHKISGDNSNGFFQFSVIKIRPSEDTPAAEEDKQQPEATVIEEKKPNEATEAEVTTIKAQQESEMNNPSLNEVDQDEKMSNTKYETDPGLLEEEPSKDAPVSLPLTQEVIYDFVPLQLQSMPLIQATKGDDGKNKPHDLSTDLRINNLMANNENGRLRTLVDPDEIEIIEV